MTPPESPRGGSPLLLHGLPALPIRTDEACIALPRRSGLRSPVHRAIFGNWGRELMETLQRTERNWGGGLELSWGGASAGSLGGTCPSEGIDGPVPLLPPPRGRGRPACCPVRCSNLGPLHPYFGTPDSGQRCQPPPCSAWSSPSSWACLTLGRIAQTPPPDFPF